MAMVRVDSTASEAWETWAHATIWLALDGHDAECHCGKCRQLHSLAQCVTSAPPEQTAADREQYWSAFWSAVEG